MNFVKFTYKETLKQEVVVLNEFSFSFHFFKVLLSEEFPFAEQMIGSKSIKDEGETWLLGMLEFVNFAPKINQLGTHNEK